MEQPEVVAAFDFDGTLSTRDNFVPFLRRVAGTGPAAEAFVLSAARLGVAGRSQWSRNEMKARVLEQPVRRPRRGRGGRGRARLRRRGARAPPPRERPWSAPTGTAPRATGS